MTRIAILADIHGNLPALDAVIEDIAAQKVDEVLVGGDLVGRGPQGSRVVQRIVGLGWPSVKGNHEDYVLTFRRGAVPENWLETDKWSASRWIAAELGPEEARHIDSLPFSLRSERARQIRLVHGSPESTVDGIGPWTSDKEMAQHLQSIAESVLVCAHTHRPLHRRLATGEVVNVGSVGLPFNCDRRAQYAIFEIRNERVEVEFRQVDYDLASILEIYETSGFLRHGGVTAKLLQMELVDAQPYLVPFLRWASILGIEPLESEIARFRASYDPSESLHSFLSRLQLTVDQSS